MFLYAKVVLDNLMDQGSEAELAEELEIENFPEELNSAYIHSVSFICKKEANDISGTHESLSVF